MHQIGEILEPTVAVEAAAARRLWQVGRDAAVSVLMQIKAFVAEWTCAVSLFEVFACCFPKQQQKLYFSIYETIRFLKS